MIPEYWTHKEVEMVTNASSYKELRTVAFTVIGRMPRPIVQVSGPISTGGAGSLEENLKRFARAVSLLKREGRHVFNQIPFEPSIQKIKGIEEPNVDYAMGILEQFYLPIFETKVIEALYFLPDWQSSVGARWEREQAGRLGISVIDFNI
ncbi:MAG: DUF4406 domain-containing protein [Parcubacteria group bacterium]|nr:DUF4406 domain-containing protein [Parcubacteria group bacterium]